MLDGVITIVTHAGILLGHLTQDFGANWVGD